MSLLGAFLLELGSMGIYDDMAARIEMLEAENKNFKEDIQYVRDLAANPNISAAQKWTMWAVRERLGKELSRGSLLSEINVYDVANDIGMSTDQAGKHLQFLAQAGALVRKQRYDVTSGNNGGGKQFRTRVMLGLTLLSSYPKQIVPLKPRNHGGKRHQCEKCGGENLEIYDAYICKDCGHIHHAELRKETKGRRGNVSKEEVDRGYE